MGGCGVESENSVCPRPLLQFFFQFLQFMSVRLRQIMSVYGGGTTRGARQLSFRYSYHNQTDKVDPVPE